MNTAKYTAAEVHSLMYLHKVVPACVNDITEAYQNTVEPAKQIERGLLFLDKDYNVIGVDRTLFGIAAEMYGIDAEKFNSAFYKSANDVIDRTRFELFIDQVIHYAGTYGQEAKGLVPLTIIPLCELKIPNIDFGKMKITVIRLVDDHEVFTLVNTTITTVKSPSDKMRIAIKTLFPLSGVIIEDIRSFEIAAMYCDYFNIVPTAPLMFLRYLIYKITGSPMIVNNQRTVNIIRAQAPMMGTEVHDLLAKTNMVELSSIFLRYKNLFLAMKTAEGCVPIINKLRRMANTYHKPLSDVAVKNYIQLVLEGRDADTKKLRRQMDNRELVKVINAMNLRLILVGDEPAAFNVRNGRTYCKDEGFAPLTDEERKLVGSAQSQLLNELVNRIRPTIEDKTFFIPDYVEYPVPVSEKQYIGNFPWGTTLICVDDCHEPMNTTIGVSWVNPAPNNRVDLDLHCFSSKGTHYGWNADYYDTSATCIYSGDMTNAPAPNGASEAFWIRGVTDPVIFTLNKFSGPEKVDFRLAASTEEINSRGDNGHYVMNPNKFMFSPIPLTFDNGNNGTTLGYYHDYNFVLYSGNLSNGAVPRGDFAKYIAAIMLQNNSKTWLSDLLDLCGANIIVTEEEKEECEGYIDLSPGALTATALLDIVDGRLV